MPASVLAQALREQRRALAVWSGAATATAVWMAAVFAALRRSPELTRFLDSVPPALLKVLGVDAALVTTSAGFLQAQLYGLLAPLAMIGLAVSLGAGVTARDEQRGTLGLVLALPVPRHVLLLQRAAAMAVVTAAVTAALTAALLACDRVFDLGLSVTGALSANLSLWLLGLLFGALAMALGALTGRPGLAASGAVGLAVAAWLLHAFARLRPSLTWLAAHSPFAWYGDHQPLLGRTSPGALTTLGLVALCTATAAWWFRRRDLGTGRAALPALARRVGVELGRATSRWPRRRRQAHVPLRHPALLRSVLAHGLGQRRAAGGLWALALVAVLLATFAAWSTIGASTVALRSVVHAVPRQLLALFGISDPAALATAAGFLSSRAYLSLGPAAIVGLAIAGVDRGLAREERDGRLELLLACGLSRRRVLLEQLAALALTLVAIVVVLTAALLLGDAAWGTGLALGPMLAANLGLALLGLCFASLTAALWATLGCRAGATRAAIALAVVSYLLHGLSNLLDATAALRWASPWSWYVHDAVPLARGVPWTYALLAATTVAGVALATRRFERRELG